MANYEQALAPARDGKVDLVVHGGDLFFRSRIRSGLVEEALRPLRPIVARGIPVLIVPGNHERSAMPYPLLWTVPGVHVFDRPRTFCFTVRGKQAVLAGFPYSRRAMDRAWTSLIEQTGWRACAGDLRLLCVHQVVEGAVVGAHNFTFRRGREIVPGRLMPRAFAAVLAGHIHRHQILTRDLGDRELACPVIYPGSTGRTSFAEREEQKGYLTIDLCAAQDGRGVLERWDFHPLPARPMVSVPLDVGGQSASRLKRRIAQLLAGLDADSIVRLKLMGQATEDVLPVLRAASLRALAPSSMNIELAWPAAARRQDGRAASAGS
jgi:DNA repair exonuclease SbcCD nuclease subunit